MTTEYDSKEQALAMGCFYAGVTTKALDGITPTKKVMRNPIDTEGITDNDVEIYTIVNNHGKKATLGVGKFRTGWELWLIDLETGMAIRT